MLHVAIGRLRTIFPCGQITLLKPHPAYETTAQVETVTSLPKATRAAWTTQRPIWSLLDRQVPGVVDRFRQHFPHAAETITNTKMRALGRNVGARDAFLRQFDKADLLLVSGGGFITDLFPISEEALNLILLAKTRNVPVAMMGQGIGPIESSRLWNKARRILPQADLIALREGRTSHPLVRELGVPDENVTVTGDDAVGLAYPEHPDTIGSAIGVNLRVAYYSKVQKQRTAELGRVLRRVGDEHSAPLRPVPIAYEGNGSDVDSIQQIMDAAGVASDGGASLDSVEAVIREVSQCRVVVTGSYHGGVFALSQGIPVVALSGSKYYDNKFHGLSDMFGIGCMVLRTDRDDFGERLKTAVATAWKQAPEVRDDLLDAARRQISAAETAYERLPHLIAAKAPYGDG